MIEEHGAPLATTKSLGIRLLYMARDFRSRALFDALRRHCRGHVLDVGGWDFFLTAVRRGAHFERWTCLEVDPQRAVDFQDERFELVVGDGCHMEFEEKSFDTVLCIQVVEHVPDPQMMICEIARVLKTGGRAILLIPQTSTTHLAPDYYGNFSRWWIDLALERAGLELIEHRPLGGLWSSAASHHFYFFLQAFRFPGMSDPRSERGILFYLLIPVMLLWALVSLPICLFLSLGDLTDEPNNHLVVAGRRAK